MIPTSLVGFLLLQTTWVVDDSGGPGVDFLNIPPAIAASADGDILLVRSGVYSHFNLSGKGLRILGEGASTVVSAPGSNGPRSTVAAIPAGSVATLQGLVLSGDPNLGPRLTILGPSTRAVLVDCQLLGPWMPILSGQFAASFALRVEGSTVHLDRCVLIGASAYPLVLGMRGGSGLHVGPGSLVHLRSSSVEAGQGSEGFGGVPSEGDGGYGIYLAAAPGSPPWLWIADCVVRGGAGGPNVGPFSSDGFGGPGLRAESGYARVSGDSQTLIQGGDGFFLFPGFVGGGTGIWTSGTASVSVHSVAVQGGAWTPGGSPLAPANFGPGISLGLPPLPVLDVTGDLSLATGSATITMSNGPGGAPFAMMLDDRPSYFGIPGPFLGEFLLEPPSALFVFDTLSAAGDFSLVIPLAGLPPSLAYLPFHLQGAALDGTGNWRLSNSVAAILRP